MTKKIVDWPAYSHDENQVCHACHGNGYVRTSPPQSMHIHRTCSICCGSGCVTTTLERKAA